MPIEKVIKVFEKYLEEMHQAFDKVIIVLLFYVVCIC